jgi:glycosyltransferase involved in cell wall biosynthesis
MQKDRFIIIYYRNVKEKVGGSGRLKRLALCLESDLIDVPIVNDNIFRNVLFYLFQNLVLSIKTLKYLKKILNEKVIIFQPYSLPGSIFVLLAKSIRGEKVILDDYNLHGLVEYIFLKIFSSFIKEVWTSSLYSLVIIRSVKSADFKVKFVPTPLYIKQVDVFNKRNIILYVASKSFKRYIDIAKEICKIAEHFPDYYFLIVGSVAEDLYCDDNCRRNNVLLLGLIPDDLYEKLLETAKYLIIFDTQQYIYPGGMLIKIVDAIEHQVTPIISSQFRFNFPHIAFIRSFTELKEALSKSISIDFDTLGRIYSCENLKKVIYE